MRENIFSEMYKSQFQWFYYYYFLKHINILKAIVYIPFFPMFT